MASKSTQTTLNYHTKRAKVTQMHPCSQPITKECKSTPYLNKAFHQTLVARTKRVNKTPLPAPRTRRGRAASQEEMQREASPFSEVVFDSWEHYERLKKVFPRGVVHERRIRFSRLQQDYMREQLKELGWLFMYNELDHFLHDFLGINVPPPERENDAYEQELADRQMSTLNLTHVLATISMPGMRWDSYNPKSDRVDNAILTPEARGWQRMIRGEKKKARKGDIAQPPPPIPPPIHEPQAPPPAAASSSTALAFNPFKKIMKMLRHQKKLIKNTHHMITQAFPDKPFHTLYLITTSESESASDEDEE
ncbi:hypothetical protein PIB30_034670 [Stylosanthes scabra]|uniref:Uncharacterized protein n=1 Tax=Stylosanthes scabra TaxID=79078 RepID=A0ABU6RD39_9FABA|nr:hypothetical protein [Stylosanthes scabra]